MIVSRPKPSTVSSFIIFFIITIVIVGMNLTIVINGQLVAWYNYAVLLFLIPIALFVANKIFLQYKVIKAGDNKIEIRYPVLRKTKTYSLSQITGWDELIVNERKLSEYKELKISFFDNASLKIGHKEYTDYEKLIQYLSKKKKKKKGHLG